MVTANAYNRFKYKTTMNESFVEKYIRAKRRNEIAAKCLFGAPSEGESEQFLSRQSADAEQVDANRRVLEKYDLADVPSDMLAEFCSPKRNDDEDNAEENTALSTGGGGSSSSSSNSNNSSDAVEGVKFQPRIVTEGNPPPSKNLFSPIDKIVVRSASPDRSKQATITDYWQTSKRRRSSSRSVCRCECEPGSQSNDQAPVEGSSSSSSSSYSFAFVRTKDGEKDANENSVVEEKD